MPLNTTTIPGRIQAAYARFEQLERIASQSKDYIELLSARTQMQLELVNSALVKADAALAAYLSAGCKASRRAASVQAKQARLEIKQAFES